MDHSRAEDIMNLVVIESKQGFNGVFVCLYFVPEPVSMIPLWSIEKHGGEGGARKTRRVRKDSFCAKTDVFLKFHAHHVPPKSTTNDVLKLNTTPRSN